jgi:hypothetical protein
MLSCRLPIPPRPLPQHILLNLPRTRFGQLVHNDNLPRHHKLADLALVLRPVDDVFAPQLLVTLDGDKGVRTLAPVRIRHGDDADFEDGGVRRELRFEGDGGYVFAACALSDPHFTYLCVYDSVWK